MRRTVCLIPSGRVPSAFNPQNFQIWKATPATTLAAVLLASVDVSAQGSTSGSSSYVTWMAVVLGVAAIAFVLFYFRKIKGADTVAADQPAAELESDGGDNVVGGDAEEIAAARRAEELGVEMKLAAQLYQLKLRKEQFSQLPINSFRELTDPRPFDLLPLSNDGELLAAIEQATDEWEPDDRVREVALRVLTALKTRNSVDALTQVALYDLSSNIRSRAVNALADFDHESVFEGVLLACADPTREVRAAAARALFRLSFDRANAWKRIVASRDDFRMSHAARAADEAGLVDRTFDRLLHQDAKVAAEAFALTALLIRANETDKLFGTLENTKDERLKIALLHVISVVQDERCAARLAAMRSRLGAEPDIIKKVNEVIAEFDLAVV